VPTTAMATDPLHDTIIIDGETRQLSSGGDALPRTQRLIAARIAQRCNAPGGPVGRYRLAEGRIWLIGLRSCGADLPVREIYPEFDDPTPALWLNGVLLARWDFLCPSRRHTGNEYRFELRLEVKDAVVTAMQQQQTNNQAFCK